VTYFKEWYHSLHAWSEENHENYQSRNSGSEQGIKITLPPNTNPTQHWSAVICEGHRWWYLWRTKTEKLVAFRLEKTKEPWHLSSTALMKRMGFY